MPEWSPPRRKGNRRVLKVVVPFCPYWPGLQTEAIAGILACDAVSRVSNMMSTSGSMRRRQQASQYNLTTIRGMFKICYGIYFCQIFSVAL